MTIKSFGVRFTEISKILLKSIYRVNLHPIAIQIVGKPNLFFTK